ncbi:hypothetical protein HRI96_03430 [Treponema parvum]|uniref:Uncharacterized protein n=1 Tax=Treponema parvum TaxID=138851 RepID=A0A975EZ32_9SPIR|nr:hypothetical protein [Treponema parvum]QTQ11328.1 hypothetical protein HRI96_03430 [Treponema parvum]
MKIKKTFLFLSFFVFLSSFALVKSVSEDQSSSISDEDVLSPELPVTLEKKSRFVRKSFTAAKGSAGVALQKNMGTFGLYAVFPEGFVKPVIASRPDFSSSGFYLKSGNSVYQLNRLGGIPYRLAVSDGSAQIVYTIRKERVQAEVSLSMEIGASSKDAEADVIKFTVETTNTGSDKRNFAVRGVFDTVLGEMAYTNFSTAKIPRIDAERQFTTMLTEKWIVSKNESTAMQIVLSGAGITPPKTVTLANRDIISSGAWDGSYYRENRIFNSIMSYNNSAVDIVWNDFSLSPGQKSAVTFYVVIGVEGRQPSGAKLLNSLAAGEPGFFAAPAISPATAAVTATAAVSAAHSASENPAASVTSSAPAETLDEAVSDPGAGDKISDSDELQKLNAAAKGSSPVESAEFNALSDKYPNLDLDYVQSLIDRINSLETSGNVIDPDEIVRLNDELDAVLSVLRNK